MIRFEPGKMYRPTEPGKKYQAGSFYRYRLMVEYSDYPKVIRIEIKIK